MCFAEVDAFHRFGVKRFPRTQTKDFLVVHLSLFGVFQEAQICNLGAGENVAALLPPFWRALFGSVEIGKLGARVARECVHSGHQYLSTVILARMTSFVLPKTHHAPHMHSWADDLLQQDVVRQSDANALGYSVQQHGLGIDHSLMNKLDAVFSKAVPDDNVAAVDVDPETHLNADAEAPDVQQLAADIDDLASAMDQLEQQTEYDEQLDEELETDLQDDVEQSLHAAAPAPKLVEPRGRRSGRKRT